MRLRDLLWFALWGTFSLVTVGCAPTRTAQTTTTDDAITVASFNFDESQVVAEIYAQALEGAGFTVHRLSQVGTRELVIPAMERGLIEIVPEYAGSAVSFLGGTPTSDEVRTHDELSELFGERAIDVLDAAQAQNHNALVVSDEVAESLSLRRISDLIPYAAGMTLGGPSECPERDLCLPGLEDTYHLRFDAFLPLDGGGSFTAEAIERGTVDIGVMFTTDGVLDEGNLVALEDDLRLQPAENLTPLVREDTIERFGPGLALALDQVSALLTTDALRTLNGQVSQGADPAEVAHEWLEAHGSTIQDVVAQAGE